MPLIMAEPSASPDSLQYTILILDKAEVRLREAAARAAAAGAYDSLTVITKCARMLQSLIAEVNSINGESTEKGLRNQYQTAARPAAAPQVIGAKPSRGQLVFSRDGDFLIKRACARRSKSEYEHRAPANVILTVAQCLSEWRTTKKLLTGPQLLDSYARRKGSVVTYQVYVVLAWLTQIGLIRRHGRSGYSVPSSATIADDVQNAWAAIGVGQSN
jgi:hypothetical protein